MQLVVSCIGFDATINNERCKVVSLLGSVLVDSENKTTETNLSPY